MAEKLIRTHGQRPTEQKDCNYFRSIYFREPGGVPFRLRTSPSVHRNAKPPVSGKTNMRMVADGNVLRSEELRAYLSKSRSNKVVLCDFVELEC
jgi:hypothetical protein